MGEKSEKDQSTKKVSSFKDLVGKWIVVESSFVITTIVEGIVVAESGDLLIVEYSYRNQKHYRPLSLKNATIKDVSIRSSKSVKKLLGATVSIEVEYLSSKQIDGLVDDVNGSIIRFSKDYRGKILTNFIDLCNSSIGDVYVLGEKIEKVKEEE